MYVKQRDKVGLVLIGGDAKEAYHEGAILALGELNIKVDTIAGASIRALNGVIIARAPDMTSGYRQLQSVWGSRASEKALKVSYKPPVYFSDLAALAAVDVRPC